MEKEKFIYIYVYTHTDTHTHTHTHTHIRSHTHLEIRSMQKRTETFLCKWSNTNKKISYMELINSHMTIEVRNMNTFYSRENVCKKR